MLQNSNIKAPFYFRRLLTQFKAKICTTHSVFKLNQNTTRYSDIVEFEDISGSLDLNSRMGLDKC